MAKSKQSPTTLIARFSALGDIAMTLPHIYDVAAAHPERRFVMLTRPAPRKMFLNSPENLEVLGIDLNKYGSAAGIFRLAGELANKYGIDTFADLHDVLRTKLLRLFLRLRGVRVAKVDKNRKGRRALTRQKNKRLEQLRPMTERYGDVFRRLGLDFTPAFTSLFDTHKPSAADYSAIIGREPLDGERWIAIAPFAKHEGKIYPAELMGRVIERLVKEKHLMIFLFGAGEYETALIEEWRKMAPDKIVNVAAVGAGFAAELALISQCNVMLSMDSANMHLASLAGTRVISVWGATRPEAGFYGFRQSPEDAVKHDMPCAPCSVYGNKECLHGRRDCLWSINPDDIVEKILQAL